MALTPTVGANGAARDRLLVSAVEHPSVLAGGRFPAQAVERLPVDAGGWIDLSTLERRLAALPGRALVSLMLANNETGIIQPVAQAARLAHEAGGLLHVDAVQGAGKIPIDINELGADFLTLSGHKIGAPKGVGALIRRPDAPAIADPLIKGGGQERGARAGTENVAGIAGFGAAAAAVREGLSSGAARMAALRDRLEAGLKAASPGIIIFGTDQQRLPNTTLCALPGMKAETAIIAFDLEGFALSSGAACSSGKVQPSHVLAAMGVPLPQARAALRISLGPTTTESEIDRFVRAWINVSAVLLKESRGIAA
jgi:cysteine desulfurase